MPMSSNQAETNKDVIEEVAAALAIVPNGHSQRYQLAKALGTSIGKLSIKAVREGRISVTPESLTEVRAIVDALRERKDEVLKATNITAGGLYKYPNGTGKRVRVISVVHGQVFYVLDGTDVGFHITAVDFAQKYVRA